MGFNADYYSSGWVSLTPQNGWTQRAGEAPLSYCVTGMTVQLRGSLNPPGILSGNLTMATLPALTPDGNVVPRPAYIYKFVAAGLTAVGVALGCNIVVNPDGTLALEGIAALGQVSLSNVRFTLAA